MQIIVIILAVAAAIAAGSFGIGGNPHSLLVLLGAVLVAIFSFFSPKTSLILLVLSMLLSPELGVGAVSSFRSVVVRYDDILLGTIFLAWFARTAIFKDKPFITATPVQTPVLLYTVLCVVSTVFGVMRGEIDWKMSSFYVLKYVEYFLLFFMTVNIVESEEDVKKYMRWGFVVAVAVTIYAYYYYYASGPLARTTAPFEVPIGGDLRESEPASLGGYYLIIFGILFSLLTETAGMQFLAAFGLIIFIFPAFLFTFSRSSYLGFAGMIPALFYFAAKRRFLLAGLVSGGLLAMALLPNIYSKVLDRITMTYKGVYATQVFKAGAVGTIRLEDSAASRVHSMQRALFVHFPKHPLFGWGVTGVGLADTQYALVLGELGLLGVVIFTWMLYRLFFTAKTVFYAYKTPAIRALALGFILSLCGLLVQSLGVNTFVIVRIMEPFWFIAACLSVLYLKAVKGGVEDPSKEESR